MRHDKSTMSIFTISIFFVIDSLLGVYWLEKSYGFRLRRARILKIDHLNRK